MYALIHPCSATSLTTGRAVAFAVIAPLILSEPWWLECSVALSLALAWWAAATDAETGRIPNRLVLLSSVPTGIVLGLGMLGGHAGAVNGAAFGLVAFAGPLLLVHVLSPYAMGFGDVKLAASLGAGVGLVDPRAGVLALCLASASTAVVAAARRRSTIPFGPGLVLGAALALVPYSSAGGPVPWH